MTGAETCCPGYLYLLTRDGARYPVAGLPSSVGQEQDAWTSEVNQLLDRAMRTVNQLRPQELQVDADLRTRKTLTAFDPLASTFGAQPGRKTLIWISHGVPTRAYSAPHHAHLSLFLGCRRWLRQCCLPGLLFGSDDGFNSFSQYGVARFWDVVGLYRLRIQEGFPDQAFGRPSPPNPVLLTLRELNIGFDSRDKCPEDCDCAGEIEMKLKKVRVILQNHGYNGDQSARDNLGYLLNAVLEMG